MDHSNLAPEENSAVKNSSSTVVQVDSIYIELPLTLPKMKMDIRCSCENGFSIRGYAASKRGSTPDVSSIYPPGRELPLMEVPSFRYWRCCSCVGIEEDATGAPEGNIADVQFLGDVQYLGALEQGLPAADANEETRAASKREDMQQGPTAPTNDIADAIQLSLSLSPPTIPEMAVHTLVPTTVIGAIEAPAEELNAGAIDLQHQSEAPRKTDRPEVDRSREIEQPSGSHKRKRKHRSLADILGVKQRSRVSEVERALDALLASKAVSEGQQSPRRKRPANQQEEVLTEKSSKRDKGKAIVTDAEDGNVRLVQPRVEGLFIGSKEERQRNRTDVAPAPSKKKAKHALTPGLSENVAKLIRELPSPPAAANLESQQQDQNDAGLSSGGLNLHTAHSRHSRLGLDLSLGTFPKRSHHQNSGAKGKKNGTQNDPGSHLQSDRSSKKGSLDLNEVAAHTSAIPFQEKMDFLQLGPKEKSSDQENQKETDSRTDDIPMDIVELLAKQQFERTNSDAGHSPRAHGSSDSTRGFHDGQLVGTSQWMRGYPGQPKFPAVGAHVASVPSSKASPLSLSQPRSSLPTLESLRSALTDIFSSGKASPSHSLSQRISSSASGRGVAQYPNSLFPPPPSSLGFGFGGQPKKDGQQHRGKTISDIKADELRKTEEARFSFSKPGSSAAASNGTGAYESYGNDSIPALQLMSLMDGGSSGTGPSAGSSRIPRRPISPCSASANPRFSKDPRRDFLSGSIFSGQIHHQELMPNPPISFQALRPHSSALPGHLSFRTPEVDMARNSLNKAGSSCGIRPDLYIPYLHDPRVRARSLAPKNPRSTADSNRPAPETAIVPAVAARTGTGRHVSADGVCRTNRNPADFSVPEPGNMYTISNKDLSKKRKKYNRRVPTVNAAAGDATNKGQQGSTSQAKPADVHPKVGSS